MERRLAAIMVADVVGYSRLIRVDEEGTIAALQALRADLIDPKIAEHHGRIVKLMGDGMLAEFPSVVDAVHAAVKWQQAIAEHNADLPDDKRIEFRVGINLGDVVVDGDDIQGDGINVAARLEGMAAPGGICVSGMVYEGVRDRIEIPFEDMGEQDVKNIDRPVQVWRWAGAAEVAAANRSMAPQRDKPTVAVLPFTNMSRDADHEHFADGITEDIITALSRTGWFDVTARNSTFAYKGRSPDIRQVAEALGVQYVLEGSIRVAGNQARITAQLIDADSGNHVWADHFDKAMDNVFEVQDAITQQVTSILMEAVWQDVAQKIERKRPEDYDAYDYAYLSIERVHRLTKPDILAAQELAEKALNLDPDFMLAHIAIGYCYLHQWQFWGDMRDSVLEHAQAHATRFRELAPYDGGAFRLLGRIAIAAGRHDEARGLADRALQINPNDGDIIANQGIVLLACGQAEESITWFDRVLELHQHTPHSTDLFQFWLAVARFMLGQFDDAIALMKQAQGFDVLRRLFLAAAYAALDRREEATAETQFVMAAMPEFRVSQFGQCQIFARAEDRDRLYSALCKAGLPE